MEVQQLKPDSETVEDQAPAAPENPERVLRFSTTFKDKLMPLANGGGERGPQKRDWSSALDLVNEAFEAIRMAEERAIAAEDYHLQLVQHHKDQIKAIESRLTAAEKRAEVAENRAKDAETWLAKFHDTIVDGFQRTFAAK